MCSCCGWWSRHPVLVFSLHLMPRVRPPGPLTHTSFEAHVGCICIVPLCWQGFLIHTYLLHCKRRKACPAFLYPHSGSAAPRWRDKRGRSAPFFHFSLCLCLCLALSPVRRSAAAGVGPRAGASWQSQQQPGKAEAEG